MKTHIRYGGLLCIILLLFASCSSLSLKATNQSSPPVAQAQHTQAVLPISQTTPDNKSNALKRFFKKCKIRLCALLGLIWLWFLARFYLAEKKLRISGWQLEDIALLKIIKDNVLHLWNTDRPDRKIIRLEDWKREL
jgi:hypothetical protein